MPRYAYTDGTIQPVADSTISIEDRGFLFGDGVYDVTRIFRGGFFRLGRHIERLLENARALEMEGLPSIEQLRDISERLRRRSDVDDGMLYMQITRGAGPRKSSYPEPPDPTVVLYVDQMRRDVDRFREDGASVTLVPDIRWRRCDIKTVNLLPKVMMKQRAVRSDCYEAIFMDEEGTVWEGTSTNLFVVRDGALHTTDHDERVLPGITRREIVEIAASEGISVEMAAVTVSDLQTADEAFLTGTLTDVLGVTRVDGDVIADGAVGPMTRMLFERLRERMAEEAGAEA